MYFFPLCRLGPFSGHALHVTGVLSQLRFYTVRAYTSRPTPNLEWPGISLFPSPLSKRV